jgi:hypothetical protein
MAKRTKKAFPAALHVPPRAAFQPDYERLSSYKDGTRIVCHIEPDGVRKGIRNWYRIIGAACSKGLLDLSKTAADELLRGALDMVVDKRMANGKWVEERQSLNDLDDAELEEKVELMKGVLLAWTGIDPDTFDREIGGSVGDENFASDVNKEGFARSPAADTAKTVEGEGGADSSSPETESGTAATSPESNTSGEAPAAAPASTPNAGSGGTSLDLTPFDDDRGYPRRREGRGGRQLQMPEPELQRHAQMVARQVERSRGCAVHEGGRRRAGKHHVGARLLRPAHALDGQERGVAASKAIASQRGGGTTRPRRRVAGW